MYWNYTIHKCILNDETKWTTHVYKENRRNQTTIMQGIGTWFCFFSYLNIRKHHLPILWKEDFMTGGVDSFSERELVESEPLLLLKKMSYWTNKKNKSTDYDECFGCMLWSEMKFILVGLLRKKSGVFNNARKY